MIFRTYGRRSSRDLGANSLNAAVSDSSSQDCSQEFYDLTLLPSRKSDSCGMGLWESRKSEIIDLDKETYESTSSQESKDLSVLEISDGVFQQSKKLKKVSSDPFDYNSSDDLTVLPKGVCASSSVFDFSEDGDVWKENKFKNVSLDSYGSDLGILPSRKRERGVEYDEFNGKIKKKGKREDRALVVSKNKKNKKKMKKKEVVECGPSDGGNMTTLMETQEFGEMMEHTDEVEFALGGLKIGQPLRVRRASLLSLLSICGTAQQRRLLRAHGMAKPISHAVMELTLDDPPSNLAAVTLLNILTSDDQDDHLLNSPSCLRFLIKLLKPLKSNSSVEEKPLLVGSRLLGMCKNANIIQDSAKETDSGCTAILMKVQEILVNCKDMKPRKTVNFGREEPELNPKWISLLTMEKACSSKISLEDIPTIFRKPGGKFKENLRESGGLDAVFEVARKCHSMMQEWLEKSPNFVLSSEDISGLESLLLLLKCLKIMENATFLSKDNQGHLLRMRGCLDGHQAPRTLTKLVLSVTKILSGVSIRRTSLGSSQDETCGTSILSGGSCTVECSSQRSFDTSLSNECFEPGKLSTGSMLQKMRVESSAAGSTSGSSNNLMKKSSDDSELKFGIRKQGLNQRSTGITEQCVDPFAFQEDELELSKWDLLSADVTESISQDSKETVSRYNNGSHSVLMFSQQESNNVEFQNSQDTSCSTAVDEDLSKLLEDCLVTSVKVLMNLTNDNVEGCQQIAAGGGLEILSSLIAGHFPSFRSYLPHSGDGRESSLLSNPSSGFNHSTNSFLNDDELDFLVAILGLLVNLVEKDHKNRSRLAAATVSLSSSRSLGSKNHIDVISLLCSIFLANQGAFEAAAEAKLDDEDSLFMGEKEAEKMIVEGYSALLLAFLSTESKSTRDAISQCLPKRNIAILVPVLERFVGFHSTLNVISPETHRTVLEVIESCRIP